MCLAQGPQRSDAGEARTRDPLISSQALYHWATALPWGCYFAWIVLCVSGEWINTVQYLYNAMFGIPSNGLCYKLIVF